MEVSFDSTIRPTLHLLRAPWHLLTRERPLLVKCWASAGCTNAIGHNNYNIQKEDAKKQVVTILTADHTGRLLVSVWSPTLDVFKNIMQQYNPEDGQLMLRFEQFKFAPMPFDHWNGQLVTPMRVAHTLTPEPEQPMKKKQKTQATTASMSLRDGTRLTKIRNSTSPICNVMSIILCRSRR